MIKLGLSGWMADFAEWLPLSAHCFNKKNPELFHNEYPLLWAKANYEAVKEAGLLDEIIYFSRSGFNGSSRFTRLLWAGDQLTNWSFQDGFATVIPAALSLGMSGIGYTHSDIGGYTSVAYVKRSKELFMRWVEHAAFSPVMRGHETNRPEKNWQFDSDEETLQHLKIFTSIFKRLKPYHMHVSQEYQDMGLPMMRPLFLHYKDKNCMNLKYQYLYGQDILMAPVIKPRRRRWKVYLPDDTWIHVYYNTAFSGNRWYSVDAPSGIPPVFYRKGSEFEGLFKELKQCWIN